MVKITLGDVDRLRMSRCDTTGSALTHLRLVGPDSPIVDRLQIARLVEALDAAVADYEKCLRSVLEDCDGKRHKDNPAITVVPPDRLAEYNSKIADLHKVEVEIPVVPLPLGVIERALTVDDLVALKPFYTLPAGTRDEQPPLRAV